MLSWASERMKMLYFTFSEPDNFLLIASWTPSFIFPSLNPLHEGHCFSYSWDWWKTESLPSIKVCCIHCAVFLSKSPEDLFPNISCSHSLTVNPVQNSIHYYLHFSDVRIECLFTVFSTSNIWLVKKKSCRWPPWDIDALIDHCVWSLIYWDCLELSDVLVHESLPFVSLDKALSASSWLWMISYSSLMVVNS